MSCFCNLQAKMGAVIHEINSSAKTLEELDSDYDVESRPSHRSLPHKKRIPRKLKVSKIVSQEQSF